MDIIINSLLFYGQQSSGKSATIKELLLSGLELILMVSPSLPIKLTGEYDRIDAELMS